MVPLYFGYEKRVMAIRKGKHELGVPGFLVNPISLVPVSYPYPIPI